MQRQAILLVLILSVIDHISFCQKADSTKNIFHLGFYFTSTFTLVRAKFPLFLQSIINKTIQTEVPLVKTLSGISV